MNIVLIGFKKSGKTTIGKILAEAIGKFFIDIDEVIIELFEKKFQEKKSIFEIFQFLNKNEFRKLETQAIGSIKKIDNAVIATSGGAVLNNNLSLFEKAKMVVYLKSEKAILKKSIQKEKFTIFKDEKFFEKEYENRKKIYSKFSNITVSTANKNIEKIIEEVRGFIHV